MRIFFLGIVLTLGESGDGLSSLRGTGWNRRRGLWKWGCTLHSLYNCMLGCLISHLKAALINRSLKMVQTYQESPPYSLSKFLIEVGRIKYCVSHFIIIFKNFSDTNRMIPPITEVMEAAELAFFLWNWNFLILHRSYHFLVSFGRQQFPSCLLSASLLREGSKRGPIPEG